MSTIFVTMVYNDRVFLDIWVRYYSRHTDRRNLHVITHGPQPYVEEIAQGCTIIEIERDPRNPRLDQDRFAFINHYCGELTASHHRVIYNDVDEIIVLDPDFGTDLVGAIEALPVEDRVVTPLGLEIIHRPDMESDYDYSRGMFNQRRLVRINGWYTKPCITNTPVIWGPDGHGSSHPAISLSNRLYLFHLKWFDEAFHVRRHQDRLKLRFKDDEGREVIVGAGSWGWSEQTYRLVTNSFLRMTIDRDGLGFDFSSQRARILRSFSGNERGMFKIDWFAGGDLRVLPERFVGLL
jgi:hypothetical protein